MNGQIGTLFGIRGWGDARDARVGKASVWLKKSNKLPMILTGYLTFDGSMSHIASTRRVLDEY